ncbi:MAG: hypothetical protein ACTHYA_11055, partial [Ancrocorticia populi]|uniref:hypothetical protein n=1 Tax=Ancrocorticia populi TaxID=2175228 RepID=UPI003F8F36A8
MLPYLILPERAFEYKGFPARFQRIVWVYWGRFNTGFASILGLGEVFFTDDDEIHARGDVSAISG